jgi:hypothetical protein
MLEPTRLMEEPMETVRHRWTEDDDVIAFYLSRHGTRRLPLMEAGIAKRLGMSEASLAKRQANFAHLDERPGLAHVAKQSIRVHQKHEKATEPALRALVLRVLG